MNRSVFLKRAPSDGLGIPINNVIIRAVALWSMFLQQFVWYLYKAEHV